MSTRPAPTGFWRSVVVATDAGHVVMIRDLGTFFVPTDGPAAPLDLSELADLVGISNMESRIRAAIEKQSAP